MTAQDHIRIRQTRAELRNIKLRIKRGVIREGDFDRKTRLEALLRVIVPREYNHG